MQDLGTYGDLGEYVGWVLERSRLYLTRIVSFYYLLQAFAVVVVMLG
jgi:hypothetical protein